MSRKTITVFKGDGIGPEITDAVLEVLEDPEELTRDKLRAFQRKYRDLLVEKTTLEDIMLFVGKGEET